MTKAKPVTRILVADDHAIFRDGLRKLLEGADDVQIIGEASQRRRMHQDAGEAEARYPPARPAHAGKRRPGACSKR